MRAIIVKEPGDASNLVLGEWETPTPNEEQILVKVLYFALNRMDLMERKGTYPVPLASPIMVTEFKKGDAVFGLLPKGGGYAEYAVMEQDLAMLKPKEITFLEAAAIPETWFVAYQALFLVGQLQAGDKVLIHAGASAVGIAAIQLAKEAGARQIFITAGSNEKVKFCESIGATRGFNYKTCVWDQEIKQSTDKKGIDLIIDFIGKNYWKENVNSLAVDGRMVVLAYVSGCQIEQDVSNFVIKRISVRPIVYSLHHSLTL
ncbi:unnamed protein product [Rhizopus stolonifer]